jgi:hypothetical protein
VVHKNKERSKERNKNRDVLRKEKDIPEEDKCIGK